MWHTWLVYLGLVGGLLAPAIFGISVVRSAVTGLAAGALLAVMANLVVPTPAPCLQNSKGWDMLRAYTLCER